MIGQGVYVQSSSPPRAPPSPPLDPCNSSISSEVLAFCTSFNSATTSTPAPPPALPPSPSDLRRLAKAPHPSHILKCPRCASSDTKFCYYNNYSLSQPRYFCKNCKRYWTAGGVLRNVPVGGGLRKNKRSKLKLAAEAEAMAAAARESSSQQPHCEGKRPSPVHVASTCATGSSDTSAYSAVVSGFPANYVVLPPSHLPSHDPTATHLPRTSSGSEGSAIDNSGINESCTVNAGSAVAYLGDQQQSCGQLQGFYGGTGVVHVGRPQYYAGNASTVVGFGYYEQYPGTSGEGSRSSYHAVGYGGSCSTDQSMGSSTRVEQVVGSNGDGLSASFSALVGKGSEAGSDVSGNHASMQDSSNSSYDWQFISENLFDSGSGTEGFLPMPGGSWPDFSPFHDPTGPG